MATRIREEEDYYGKFESKPDSIYNKIAASQVCSREKLSTSIRQRAESLQYQVNKMQELAKFCDLLSSEVEDTLYPIIIDYIHRKEF